MKWRCVLVAGLLLMAGQVAQGQTVADLEDIVLPASGVLSANGGDAIFTSVGAGFNADWNEAFNCCASAWSISNHTDLTTVGFTNQHSAFALPAGGGANGSSQFGVANNFFPGHARVALPEPTIVQGAYFTNNTYAYRAIVDGHDNLDSSGNPTTSFVKGPFVDGDFFRLDIIGKDAAGAETGAVEFYLADYRNGQAFAANEWTWVDLTSLGEEVVSLEFGLASTDNGPFGMNTPSYFALDNLTFGQAVAAVPEPSSILCAMICFVAAIVGYRLTRRRRHAS